MAKFDHDYQVVLDSSKESQGILVNGTATARSEIIKVDTGEYFSLAYEASSGGIVDVILEIEQSHDGVKFEIPVNSILKDKIENTDYLIKKLYPIPAPYIRFKLTGSDGNAASTRLNIWLSRQGGN